MQDIVVETSSLSKEESDLKKRFLSNTKTSKSPSPQLPLNSFLEQMQSTFKQQPSTDVPHQLLQKQTQIIQQQLSLQKSNQKTLESALKHLGTRERALNPSTKDLLAPLSSQIEQIKTYYLQTKSTAENIQKMIEELGKDAHKSKEPPAKVSSQIEKFVNRKEKLDRTLKKAHNMAESVIDDPPILKHCKQGVEYLNEQIKQLQKDTDLIETDLQQRFSRIFQQYSKIKSLPDDVIHPQSDYITSKNKISQRLGGFCDYDSLLQELQVLKLNRTQAFNSWKSCAISYPTPKPNQHTPQKLKSQPKTKLKHISPAALHPRSNLKSKPSNLMNLPSKPVPYSRQQTATKVPEDRQPVGNKKPRVKSEQSKDNSIVFRTEKTKEKREEHFLKNEKEDINISRRKESDHLSVQNYSESDHEYEQEGKGKETKDHLLSINQPPRELKTQTKSPALAKPQSNKERSHKDSSHAERPRNDSSHAERSRDYSSHVERSRKGPSHVKSQNKHLLQKEDPSPFQTVPGLSKPIQTSVTALDTVPSDLLPKTYEISTQSAPTLTLQHQVIEAVTFHVLQSFLKSSKPVSIMQKPSKWLGIDQLNTLIKQDLYFDPATIERVGREVLSSGIKRMKSDIVQECEYSSDFESHEFLNQEIEEEKELQQAQEPSQRVRTPNNNVPAFSQRPDTPPGSHHTPPNLAKQSDYPQRPAAPYHVPLKEEQESFFDRPAFPKYPLDSYHNQPYNPHEEIRPGQQYSSHHDPYSSAKQYSKDSSGQQPVSSHPKNVPMGSLDAQDYYGRQPHTEEMNIQDPYAQHSHYHQMNPLRQMTPYNTQQHPSYVKQRPSSRPPPRSGNPSHKPDFTGILGDGQEKQQYSESTPNLPTDYTLPPGDFPHPTESSIPGSSSLDLLMNPSLFRMMSPSSLQHYIASLVQSGHLSPSSHNHFSHSQQPVLNAATSANSLPQTNPRGISARKEAEIRLDVEIEHGRILLENATARKPLAMPLFEPTEPLIDSPGVAAFLVSDSDLSSFEVSAGSEAFNVNKESLGEFFDNVKHAKEAGSIPGKRSEGEIMSDAEGLSSGEVIDEGNLRVSTSQLLVEDAVEESEGEFNPSSIFNV